MATLIPSYSTCAARMQAGERRFAQRLEAKLEDDYLCWYDVPVGPTNSHPDFIILHPRRGLLILEVKDWKPETIQTINKADAAILTPKGLKHVLNPLEQARQYAHAVTNVLERDTQLTFFSGKFEGRLTFPWTYGVVLAGISRRTFDTSGLAEVIEPHRVICQDEMVESVDAEAFQQRLSPLRPGLQDRPRRTAQGRHPEHVEGRRDLRRQPGHRQAAAVPQQQGPRIPDRGYPRAGLLPTPDKATEEEARLLYVAMTRAAAQLIVTGTSP